MKKQKDRYLIKRITCAVLAAAMIPIYGIQAFADYSLGDAQKDLPYYYNALSSKEKTIYDRLRQGVLNGESKVSTTLMDSAESYNKICELILYNDELTFGLSGISAETTGSQTFFFPTYAIDKYTYSLMLEQTQAVTNKIAKKALKIEDEYERIKYIYEAIGECAEYFPDNEDYVGYTHYAYGALVEGRAVCQGYSSAFAYVCRKADIKCITVYGTSRGESHSWNKVMCDGKWYNVDLTWDDAVSNFKGGITYNYFMLSDFEFAKDHTAKSIVGTDMPCTESRDYYNEYDLVADDYKQARDILERVLPIAAEDGEKTVTVRLKNAFAYDNFIKYIEYNDRTRIKAMLKTIPKSAKVNKKAAWYIADPDKLTVQFVIVYKNAELSDYFKEVGLISEENLVKYKEMGLIMPEKSDEGKESV